MTIYADIKGFGFSGATLPTERRDIESELRGKLIELIRLSAKHGIRIESLMREALDPL